MVSQQPPSCCVVSEDIRQILENENDVANIIGIAMRRRMETLPLLPQYSKASFLVSKTKPTIDIEAYIQRLMKWSLASPSCLVASYALIRRFDSGAFLSQLSTHRLLLTCFLLSVKMMEDRYYTQDHYAAVGGVSTEQMNAMELELLHILGWNPNVTISELSAALEHALSMVKQCPSHDDSSSSSSLSYVQT